MIFTLSNSSLHPDGGGVMYVASKHAALGIVRQLAHELAPDRARERRGRGRDAHADPHRARRLPSPVSDYRVARRATEAIEGAHAARDPGQIRPITRAPTCCSLRAAMAVVITGAVIETDAGLRRLRGLRRTRGGDRPRRSDSAIHRSATARAARGWPRFYVARCVSESSQVLVLRDRSPRGPCTGPGHTLLRLATRRWVDISLQARASADVPRCPQRTAAGARAAGAAHVSAAAQAVATSRTSMCTPRCQ